ncbi:MAG: phosphotransferase [Acetobacteraceae bacterium]
MTGGDALDLAGRLAMQAGLPAPRDLVRLSGGKNNRVFRVGAAHVLKLYHWDERDPRDRLRAEWRFLRYAWDRGVRNIPRPLAKDDAAHAGLYTLLPGAAPAEVSAWHVAAALDFLLAVNAAPRDPAALDPGSEACFSLAEHVATIDRRVARLGALDPAAPLHAAAQALVAERLAPLWDRVRVSLPRGEAPLEAMARCVSPSDFGFHNALEADGRVAFIDFEYAGSDDPAKLVCDFFCQPQVKVPLHFMPDFTRRLIAGLGLDTAHERRCHQLLDAYRIKWACIILNDFLPLGSSRRAHADLARTEERCAFQLARARAKLDEIEGDPHRGVS